jgi:hypothetical protein
VGPFPPECCDQDGDRTEVVVRYPAATAIGGQAISIVDVERRRQAPAPIVARAPGKIRKEQKSKGESNHAHFNIVILAVAASLNAIVIAPAFAADDAKSIAERVIAKWGKSTTKAMLRP